MELLRCDVLLKFFEKSVKILEVIKNISLMISIFYRELAASGLGSSCRIHGTPPLPAMLCPEDLPPPPLSEEPVLPPLCRRVTHWHHCPELHKAIDGVRFIADHTKREEDSTKVPLDPLEKVRCRFDVFPLA